MSVEILEESAVRLTDYPDVVREIAAQYDARTGEAAVLSPLWPRSAAANCCSQIRIRAEVAQLVEHTTEKPIASSAVA